MNRLCQDPGILRKRAAELHNENGTFRQYLHKKYQAQQTDELFSRQYAVVAPAIDCTECAACCSGLQPEISREDYVRYSAAGKESDFLSINDTESSTERFYIKDPCCFLHNKRCSIYEDRPSACSGYPHLDQPGTRYRLRTIFEQTKICPIVFHVIEALKTETGFNSNT